MKIFLSEGWVEKGFVDIGVEKGGKVSVESEFVLKVEEEDMEVLFGMYVFFFFCFYDVVIFCVKFLLFECLCKLF